MSEMPQLVPTYRALLSDRQRREADFYNRKTEAVSAAAPDADLMLRLDRYPVPGPHLAFGFERALQFIGDLGGLRVLDLGCGDGRTAVWFALRGAIVVGADVSEGSLAVARRRAALHGVTATTQFVQVPAEDLAAAFGPGSFDAVFGYAVIHHTRLPVLTANLAGVLRGQGASVFPFEPIAFSSPAERFRKSKLMRKIAPVGNETEDESIIFISELSALETDFVVDVTAFHLSTQVQALIPANRRTADRLERIFQLSSQAENGYEELALRLANADRHLLRRFPKLRALCRHGSITLRRLPVSIPG